MDLLHPVKGQVYQMPHDPALGSGMSSQLHKRARVNKQKLAGWEGGKDLGWGKQRWEELQVREVMPIHPSGAGQECVSGQPMGHSLRNPGTGFLSCPDRDRIWKFSLGQKKP